MSLMVESDSSAPRTRPIETRDCGVDRARDRKLDSRPLSSSALRPVSVDTKNTPTANKQTTKPIPIVVRRPCMSERLSDADIESPAIVARTPVERHRDIDTNGADGGVVAAAE